MTNMFTNKYLLVLVLIKKSTKLTGLSLEVSPAPNNSSCVSGSILWAIMFFRIKMKICTKQTSIVWFLDIAKYVFPTQCSERLSGDWVDAIR